MLYLKDKSNEKIIVKLEDENLSKFQIKMIKLNEISELIEFEVFNNETEINFYTSGLISFESFLIKYGYKADEEKLLNELRLSLEKISNFMLPLSNIKLDLDEIYLDEDAINEKNEIRFKLIYIPRSTSEKEKRVDDILNILREDIRINTFQRPKEKENYEEFARIYDELEKEEKTPICTPKWSKNKILWLVFGVYALNLLIFHENMEITLISSIVFGLIFALVTLYFKFQRTKENLTCNDETMVMESYPTLKKGLFDDKIPINSSKFVIGKGDGVNLSLSSNLISKRHAMIEKGKLGYYIRDLNSTNHTFVNNTKLLEGEEKYLASGDKIKFASDSYVYTFEYA